MLNMSIISFRYKQFASKICNAISDVLVSLQTHNLSPQFDSLHHWTNSYAQQFGSVRQKKSEVRFGFGKNSWLGRFLVTVLTIV